MQIAALYQSVTQSIIHDLENGAPPWLKPWKNGNRGNDIMPVNAITGRQYHGINIPILWGQACDNGYAQPRWLTFKQAFDKKAAVRKGEKGTSVVFTKRLRVKDQETDEEKTLGMLKVYYVFNVAQIDGLPEPEDLAVAPAEMDPFIAAIGADIRHGGDEAMFVPSKDFILMPPIAAFKSVDHYRATLLHEAGHWSGHEKRLNRNLANRFGTKAYAAEELVAELTSAFLCAHLGIEGQLRHAGYIQNWITLLKSDDRAIFTAASKASQAADYLRAFSETIEEERDAA